MADDLQSYLNALPDQITEELSSVVREQAFRLSDAQRQALQSLQQAPEETGALEASCTVAPGSSPLEYFVQAGGEITTRNGYDHAVAFEFGNSRQPARSFFYPTYNALKDDMQEEINKAISEILK